MVVVIESAEADSQRLNPGGIRGDLDQVTRLELGGRRSDFDRVAIVKPWLVVVCGVVGDFELRAVLSLTPGEDVESCTSVRGFNDGLGRWFTLRLPEL